MRQSVRTACYPSDCSDAEWDLIAPLLPAPACRTAAGGHPEAWHRRDIVDAIRYMTDNGCKWRGLPADFPPWKTVYGFFARWSQAGVVTQMHHGLRDQVRVAAGRKPDPTAAVIDSQSVKACATVGKTTRGYDAGKRINGRKRHIAVDTMGLLLLVMVLPANVQDRTAARDLLFRLRILYGHIAMVWADGGYEGKLAAWAESFLDLSVRIIRKIAGQTTFIALPRRWVVERTFAWTTNRRRNTRDYERNPQHSEAFIYWASIITLTRRLSKMG
ncbi:MAG: IS5 family transposase [Paeniglutamicibacter sp.]